MKARKAIKFQMGSNNVNGSRQESRAAKTAAWQWSFFHCSELSGDGVSLIRHKICSPARGLATSSGRQTVRVWWYLGSPLLLLDFDGALDRSSNYSRIACNELQPLIAYRTYQWHLE